MITLKVVELQILTLEILNVLTITKVESPSLAAKFPIVLKVHLWTRRPKWVVKCDSREGSRKPSEKSSEDL